MTEAFDFQIEESKDGYRILRINKDNKKVYVGSKYRMKDKIDELLKEDIDIKDDATFIIFGIGTGEYIKELYKKNNNIKIVIFEPNVRLIEYIKNNPSEYEFLIKKNIYLLNAKTEEEVYIGLRSFIGEFDLNKIIYKCLLNYDKIYEKSISKFNEIVKNFLNDVVIRRNTSMFFHRRWFDTLISNLKYIIESSPINLFKDKYKNVPAVVVSAGPSLNKNIDDLHNINKDMLILSGGRTLRPLVEKNIEPDLIGIVDPGEISYKLVEGYIEKAKAPLLFYEGTNEDVVKRHNGEKIVFTQNYMIHDIFDMEIKDVGAGGSVAHDLTSTAIYLGCNPIIFIGQDLAYTGEKYHADIAINQFNNISENKISEDTKDIYVEDINGDKVRTSEVLDNFRRELENIININKDINFINATEGGAKIKGTIQMTLKDAIEKYKLNDNINFFQKINNSDKNKVKNKVKNNTIKILSKVIEANEKIIKDCKKALDIINFLNIYIANNKNSKINKCLKDLNVIDGKIKVNYESMDILRSIIYPIIYSILTGAKPKNNEEIIKNNEFLYQSILDISKEVLIPIKNCKENIEKMEFDNV